MGSQSNAAVATLTATELLYRDEKVFFPKIRPKFGRDVHFGVGELPEEKVRDSHFTGGADEQIGVGIIAGIAVLAEHLDVDHRGVDVSARDFMQETLNPVDDLQSSAVTQRKDKREAVVVCRPFDRFVQLLLAGRGQIR